MMLKSISDKKWILGILYTIYTIFLYIVIVFKLPTVLETSYNGLLFPYRYKPDEVIISIIAAVALLIILYKKYSTLNNLSEITVLLLILLYFLPGLFTCSVTETPKYYLLSYLIFTFSFIYFDRHISINLLKKTRHCNKKNNTINILLIAIVLTTIMFVVLFGQSFSLARFLLALSEVYDVRANADEFHWIFFNIEQWAVYFGAILIVYFIKKKKHMITITIVICELFFFSMQANKIDIFVTILAILLGYIKITPKSIALYSTLLMMVIYCECVLFENGFIFTDVFRRFSIVPNRICCHYFDYFQNHEPDYLCGEFSRISHYILGISSKYDNISHIIGKEYYHSDVMGANTGMMASGVFNFGNIGIIIEAFFIPLTIKVFENCCSGIKDYSVLVVLAIILTTIFINLPTPFSNLLGISYLLMMAISLYISNYSLKNI